MKKNNIVLWGDLCIDENNLDGQKINGPGGSVFYCGRTLKNLDCNVSIISPRGSDYNDDWLGGILVYPEEPLVENTFLYQNCYDSNGKRILYAKNQKQASFINPLFVPKELFSRIQAVVVCPIDNNITYSHLKDLKARMDKKSLLACLPQGFFRRYQKDGKVYKSEWKDSEKFIPFFDIIFLSEEDWENLDEKAVEWSREGPLVVITRSDRGCSIFKKGIRINFPAFKVKKVIDPVGAGDVFSAAFVHSYLLYRDIEKAAIFANAIACISLSFHVLEMNITVKEVNDFLELNKEN